MTFIIGLTGSIGMGKSTTAQFFAEEGCAVWDADAAVHRLYSAGGVAVAPIKDAFPEAVTDEFVSREKLKEILRQRPDALKDIERIVHPLVAQDRADFLRDSESDIGVFDIPLLFETGADQSMHATVCVTIDAKTQKARVMARGKMTEQDFQTIMAKQMPDAEKREKADYVVVTDSVDHARAQVQAIVREIWETRDA